MAAKTLYLEPDQTITNSGLTETDTGAEATTATGWTVAKIAPTAYQLLIEGSEGISGGFGASAEPDTSGAPGTTFGGAGNSALESPVYSGTFDAGVWTLTAKVIAVTSGGDADGNLRFRIYRAANGVAATQLTAGTIDCGTVTNLTTAAAQTSAGSTPSIGPFTLTNEAIFLSLAWKITGAGGANTRDVIMRKGTGITLVTPNFTASGGAAASLIYQPYSVLTSR